MVLKRNVLVQLNKRNRHIACKHQLYKNKHGILFSIECHVSEIVTSIDDIELGEFE
jgi:hypothetical protein